MRGDDGCGGSGVGNCGALEVMAEGGGLALVPACASTVTMMIVTVLMVLVLITVTQLLTTQTLMTVTKITTTGDSPLQVVVKFCYADFG